MSHKDVVGVPKADCWTSKLNGFFKTRKNRLERRRAKRNPQCLPAYGRYRGYLS